MVRISVDQERDRDRTILSSLYSMYYSWYCNATAKPYVLFDQNTESDVASEALIKAVDK